MSQNHLKIFFSIKSKGYNDNSIDGKK